MSVIQSTQEELRYLKRQNLEQESRIIGNQMRDIIRSYGVDCIYHKLDTSEFTNFKDIVDKNAILKKAYGYDIDPDYTLSAHMLTYCQVQQDIFLLNKFGLNPNADVDFFFDSTDFACSLATVAGQYREYPIDEKDIVCEVPDNDLSNFPFDINKGYTETYTCNMLTGYFSAILSGYEYKQPSFGTQDGFVTDEHTILCYPYEHTKFSVQFPANDDLYRSLKHTIESDEYLETILKLTYRIHRVCVYRDPTNESNSIYKNMLRGKLHGSLLFFDVNQIGKYVEKIHPMVGDIITIDFPDETSREQYEITDCFDKQLTTDGISPLLHKYVWQCKARRYVNSHEQMEDNEANDRLEENIKYQEEVIADVTDKIELYPDGEDAAYGGYDKPNENYDKQIPNPLKLEEYTYIDGDQNVTIHEFNCGSKLVTDGYTLAFITSSGAGYIPLTEPVQTTVNAAYFPSNQRWLKATKDMIVFVNIEGKTTILKENVVASDGVRQICINDLYLSTLDTGNINQKLDNFFKFKECKSFLWATPDNLFAKLESSDVIYLIA